MSKRTVFQLLDQAAIKYANKPYLSEKNDEGWKRTSFSEAKEKARILAYGLMALDLQYQDKVAILSEAKTDWIIAEFATLYAGAISVPLSIKLLPEEVPFRVNHSDAKLFIVSENTLERVVQKWDLYQNTQLKLIVLDKPSDKINSICQKAQFNQDNLIFINDIYALGQTSKASFESKLEDLQQHIKEDDVVTISYTSGTTGNPKGIMLTHLNYFSNSKEAVNTFKIEAYISTLLILPTDHSFAHTIGIYTALVKGLSIHFVDARGGGMNALKNIPINLVEANPNFLLTVPALTSNFIHKIEEGIKAKGGLIETLFRSGIKAAIIRNGNGYNPSSLFTKLINWPAYIIAETLIFKKLRKIFGDKIEFFVGGGALLDIKQQQFYKAIGIPVYQGYGLTEAAPIISTNTPFNHKMGTSGKILGGITCKICDDEGNDLPQGQKGEIVIKGDNVMKGYYKNDEATASTLINGWLHTGDLGYIDQDQFLVVVGREKALLISEDGEKYSPEEIEEAIVNSSPCIAQTMIYNDHKKFTTALITLNENEIKSLIQQSQITSTEALEKALKNQLLAFQKQKEFKGKFPSKWIPTHFQVIEEAFTEDNKMINSTMKMVRHKITETYQDRLDMMYAGKGNDLAAQANHNTLKKYLA